MASCQKCGSKTIMIHTGVKVVECEPVAVNIDPARKQRVSVIVGFQENGLQVAGALVEEPTETSIRAFVRHRC